MGELSGWVPRRKRVESSTVHLDKKKPKKKDYGDKLGVCSFVWDHGKPRRTATKLRNGRPSSRRNSKANEGESGRGVLSQV